MACETSTKRPLALQKVFFAGSAEFVEAIEKAQTMDRHRLRDRATEQFDSDWIVDKGIIALHAVQSFSDEQGSPRRHS